MTRQIGVLSPAKVKAASRPGLYSDGGNLALHVGKKRLPDGSVGPSGKSWVFRYTLNGQARTMGIGPCHTVSLSEARARARELRLKLLDGVDPIEERRARRGRLAAETGKAVTFKEAAIKYIRANRGSWRNAVHAAQWDRTLEAYAYPVIGPLPVGAIETAHLTKILEPIWAAKAETASRVRGRIEAILDYAKVHGWRSGENPARWKGHLEIALGSRPRGSKGHHAALPWRDVPAFMAALEREKGVAALALRFTVLTAARSGEVFGATWSEIDLGNAVWTVPAGRMKAGREHRVPLSRAAAQLLAPLAPGKGQTDFVFPGAGPHRPRSNMSMSMLLRRLKRDGATTVHGLRSSFRDWVAETGRPGDLAEAALAHVVGDKTVAAYLRGDLFDRRRTLMTQWAEFCSSGER